MKTHEQFMKQQQKLLQRALQFLEEILTEKKSVQDAKKEYKMFLETEFTEIERNTIKYILENEKNTPTNMIWIRDLFVQLLDSEGR